MPEEDPRMMGPATLKEEEENEDENSKRKEKTDGRPSKSDVKRVDGAKAYRVT